MTTEPPTSVGGFFMGATGHPPDTKQLEWKPRMVWGIVRKEDGLLLFEQRSTGL